MMTQTINLELYVPEGTTIVPPTVNLLDEPNYQREGIFVAWILYFMANTDGISAVMNRMLDIYNDPNIDRRKMRMCLMAGCREFIIDYLSDTNQLKDG